MKNENSLDIVKIRIQQTNSDKSMDFTINKDEIHKNIKEIQGLPRIYQNIEDLNVNLKLRSEKLNSELMYHVNKWNKQTVNCFRKQIHRYTDLYRSWNNDPSLFSPEVDIQYWLVHRDWRENTRLKYYKYWGFHGFHNIQRWNLKTH